jgi:hypothetical protein
MSEIINNKLVNKSKIEKIYIRRLKKFDILELVHILEFRLNLGSIKNIRFELTKSNNIKYYNYYILFNYWKNSDNAEYILSRLVNYEETHLYYDINKYLTICMDQSDWSCSKELWGVLKKSWLNMPLNSNKKNWEIYSIEPIMNDRPIIGKHTYF